MRTQLIQKKVQIGSQVEFTLATGNQISGLLTGIGLDHITLDGAKGEMTILVESIIAVQNLDNIDSIETPSNTPNLNNQADTFDPSNSKPNKIESPDSANNSPSEVKASGSSDTDTALIDSTISEQNETHDQDGTPDTADTNTKLKDSDPEQIMTSDTADANTESADPVPELIIPSEATDANTESIDSAPEQTAVSDVVGTHTELGTSNFEKQASEKLTEIEDLFSIQIKSATATIGLAPPNLAFPAEELKGWKDTPNTYLKWKQIKDYEDSQKTGELDSKSDRILSIIDDLKSLIVSFPDSPALKRTLAYFYSLSSNWMEALQNYQAVAIQSEMADDWCDVAVCALVRNNETLACYSLWKYFREASIIDAENELMIWYTYVGLLEKFKSLPDFRALCGQDGIKDDEIEVLLDTAIYLLKKTETEALATGIIQKRLIGESAECLLVEACQKLDSQSVKSYRDFFSQFNDLIALEKKNATKKPKPSKHINSVKRPVSQSTKQKQKRQTYSTSGRKGPYYNLYKQAEVANIRDKNLEQAERLYGECMKRDIEFESALKDRAMVLARLERYEEAENLLLLENNRQKVKDKQPVDRLLVNIYQKWGEYRKAIDLLNDLLSQTQDIEKRTDILWQIGSTYLKLEDYVNAETKFRQVQKQRPDNITVKRNIAVCLLKQPETQEPRELRYDKAEKILNEIQETSPDVKTAELLEAIQRAKTTNGEFSLDENNAKEFLSDFSFSRDASGFAQFFLKRCELKEVKPERVIDGIDGKKYEPPSERLAVDDMKMLAERADDPKQIGRKRPDQRTSYLLSAAKICDMGFGDRNDFYRYLCSSFTSQGDLALTENLNTAQAWYREALIAYDKIMLSDIEENDANIAKNDAKNSLARYLHAIDQSSNEIPIPPGILSIPNAVKDLIQSYREREKVFNAIAYLVSHSRYATQQILEVLYEDCDLQRTAIGYLQNLGIPIPDIDSLDVFSQLWKDLENRNVERVHEISNALRLLNDFELSQAWLTASIEISQNLREKLLFELDENRIRDLLRTLETAHDLCGRSGFEDRDRLCKDLKRNCQDLLKEIERKPTNLSIKYIYSIIEIIQEKVNVYSKELYESSKPELDLRLADDDGSQLLEDDGTIDVQIVVENEEGRMPAENLKLIPELDAALFREKTQDIELGETLYGGKEAQKIRVFHLHLTEYAIRQEAFSFRVRAEYTIPFPGGEKDAQDKDFTISLSSKDKFETIYNPYADYARGNEVVKKDMFFGREELIDSITADIQQSVPQSKCVLVYGQYRSGKSSVRLHLKKKLDENDTLLVADLKDITLNRNTDRSVLCQIFARILTALREAVENRVNDNDLESLNYNIPSDEELENHSDPQLYFERIIFDFKRVIKNEWGVQQIVILIDEFQYIYQIMVTTDKLDPDFMQVWKRFLQINLFSAVLVGQQVMAKFEERFPNAFAGMQHQKVSYLTEHDAKRLIKEPILIGGDGGRSRYRERAVEQIVKLTACSPYYIQIICDLLVKYMNKRRIPWVTEADVQFVTESFLKTSSDEAISHIFTDSGDRSEHRIPQDDILKVLRTIAENDRVNTNGCPQNLINCETKIPINNILDELVTRDVLERNQGTYYQIKVGLFKEWLIL